MKQPQKQSRKTKQNKKQVKPTTKWTTTCLKISAVIRQPGGGGNGQGKGLGIIRAFTDQGAYRNLTALLTGSCEPPSPLSFVALAGWDTGRLPSGILSQHNSVCSKDSSSGVHLCYFLENKRFCCLGLSLSAVTLL